MATTKTTEKTAKVEQEGDQAAYVKTQEEIAKQQEQSVAVPPVPAEPLDIPSTEPYPTGSPQQPSYAEINGLVPRK